MKKNQEVSSISMSDYAEQIALRVLSQKKVKATREEIDQLISSISNYIDYFNNIREFQKVIMMNNEPVSLDSIPVLNEFREWITPSSVKYVNSDPRCIELLAYSNQANSPGSMLDYINLCDQFRALFKKDSKTDITYLSDIKVAVSLNDMISKLNMDGQVNFTDAPYIPINLNEPTLGFKFFRSVYVNSEADFIIESFITKQYFD
jgi:hypothetical protein